MTAGNIFRTANEDYALVLSRDENGRLILAISVTATGLAIALDTEQEELLLDALLGSRLEQLSAERAKAA